MVIGREVKTAWDARIDILAINRDGNLVVLELKRNMTPREIVAQTLDYGSWVRELRGDDVAMIFSAYLTKHHPEKSEQSLDQAFCEHFGVSEMPEEINDAHELVIVASSLDPSTERIVQYLSDEYSVNINAVFFRVFKDGEREYLCRAWLREPGFAGDPIAPAGKVQTGDWNGQHYVSFGHGDRRRWEEAAKYGFISAGFGNRYSGPLRNLSIGDSVWVNVPGKGYVGVGTVSSEARRADQFLVESEVGPRPLTEASEAPKIAEGIDDERAEWVVGVNWTRALTLDQAIREKGLFGNQNTVAKPTVPKWDHTIDRLTKRFGLDQKPVFVSPKQT